MDTPHYDSSFGRVAPRISGVGQVHLFGSMGILLTGADYPEFTQTRSLNEACSPNESGCGGCARTWGVTLTGREIQRFSAETPLAPIGENDFDNPPAGSLSVPRSQLKFRITADLGWSGLRRFFADAGQSFEVHANRVCIEWFAPAAFQLAGQNLSAGLTPVTGFVVDARIGAEAAIVETAIGLRDVTFTTHLFVPATATGTLIVPAYAQEVTIYQTGAGAAATQWMQTYGIAPVGPIDIAAIPFIAGARKTEPQIVLPDATHFRTDIDAANDRFFTLRWTIRP
jgi:hypothetical protein